MPDSQRRVHNRLAVLRTERGLSRKQIADKLDVNYQTIGYIERGDYNPSLELALSIAELFRLPVEAIFSLTPMTPLSQELYGEPPAAEGKGGTRW
jgi:putative transcriptional regulator